MSTPEQIQQEKEFNPETTARFRRESWWQVTFPVILVVMLLITGAILVLILGGRQSTSIVADYSLALLIIVDLIIGLLVLATIAALAYGIARLVKGIPPYTYKVQNFLQGIYEWVDHQTNRLANIVIVAKSTLIGMNVYLQQQGFSPEPETEPSAPEAEKTN